MIKKWMIIVLFVLLCLFGYAAAEEIIVEEIRTQMGESAVSYPQLKGMSDEAVQQKINDDIVLSSGVTNHMVTLFTLSGQQKLTVGYDSYLNDQLFSVVLSARGKLPKTRDGHEYTALTYDLKTGERLTLDQLFTDVDSALAAMEEKASAALSEELNGYMEYSDITPLPADSFTVNENGITFWYPSEQFSLVSGYSGACRFLFEELEAFLIAPANDRLAENEQKALVEDSVSNGMLPHVPAALGQNLQELIVEYRLLRVPDEFPGGRYFLLEHPEFQGVVLISDSLQEEYANSVVEGIQLRRGGIHGLLIGQTTQTEWQQILGMPASNVVMTESMAYDYGLCEGSYDVYHYGSHELRLYEDAEGVLCAVQLCD